MKNNDVINNYLENFKNRIDRQRVIEDYIKKTPATLFFNTLREKGIEIYEEDIIEIYRITENFSALLDYYIDEYEDIWIEIDRNDELSFNSDTLFYILDKFIREKFDVENGLDPFYMEDKIYEIDVRCDKKNVQKEMMKLMERMIAYGQKNNVHKLSMVFDDIDIHAFLKYNIKRCHHRDSYFKDVMKRLYETYGDVDCRMYKIK